MMMTCLSNNKLPFGGAKQTMTMNTEYSKEMIEFADDVADMMALRNEYLTKKAKHRTGFGRVDGEDVEEAYHNFKKAESQVKEWLKDILGEED
jgi:hypothetical protein